MYSRLDALSSLYRSPPSFRFYVRERDLHFLSSNALFAMDSLFSSTNGCLLVLALFWKADRLRCSNHWPCGCLSLANLIASRVIAPSRRMSEACQSYCARSSHNYIAPDRNQLSRYPTWPHRIASHHRGWFLSLLGSMTPPVVITEQYIDRTLGECEATELYTAEQVCAEKARRWVNWVSLSLQDSLQTGGPVWRSQLVVKQDQGIISICTGCIENKDEQCCDLLQLFTSNVCPSSLPAANYQRNIHVQVTKADLNNHPPVWQPQYISDLVYAQPTAILFCVFIALFALVHQYSIWQSSKRYVRLVPVTSPKIVWLL